MTAGLLSPLLLPPLLPHPLRFMDTAGADADVRLVERMVAGDEAALGALYDRFGTLAYSLALAMLRDAADAEEVVSEAFAQLWRSAAQFVATRGAVQAWVVTVVRSRALDRLRARRRAAAATQRFEAAAPADAAGFMAEPAASPAAVGEAVDLRDRVAAAIAQLTPAQRTVVELAYFDGLSQREIAERLDEPLGTIKTRARAALTQLRDALGALRARGAV